MTDIEKVQKLKAEYDVTDSWDDQLPLMADLLEAIGRLHHTELSVERDGETLTFTLGDLKISKTVVWASHHLYSKSGYTMFMGWLDGLIDGHKCYNMTA